MQTQTQQEDQQKRESKTSGWDGQPKRPVHCSKITIVGDSMLKYLNPTKLRQNLRKRVFIRTFPGAKATDMRHYVQPTLSRSPEISARRQRKTYLMN